jgi:hypothetical protein
VPRVTVLPNGVTASCPRFGPMADTPPRGAIRGWSPQAAARLRRWFYSVDGAALDGHALALTLTIRDLPPAAADWGATRKAFVERMRRSGAVRLQWLTEWQRRGVPHMHGIVYFPEASGDFHELVATHWLEAAAPWGPDRRGQVVKPVHGLAGWLQYQAKHSARGVRHYQRATVPEAWQKGTGRLWGTSGDWPTREELVPVSMEAYWRFRRGLRSWLIAGARAGSDYRRLSWLRRMLADPEASRSAVRAVGEFVPEAVSWQLLHASLLDAELVPPGVSRGRK